MKITDLITEKINTAVKFNYIEDLEGDENRGWQVDKIEAYLNDKLVGYIKVSWIPRQRFDQHYKTIAQYVSKVAGSVFLPYEYVNEPNYNNIPVDVLRSNLFSAASTVYGYVSYEQQQQFKKMSDEQVIAKYRQLEKMLHKKYGKRFDDFREYYVDKPIIDFIRVDDQYRRQGIGTALYRAAHEWLKQKHLKLYASGIQTDEAKAAWSQMEKDYPVGQEQATMSNKTFTRRFLQ